MKQSYTVPRGQLDGVEAFLRVAERRSFRAAADDLGVSPSAISQTIRALETRVGAALLTRTTRSVGLTQAGQYFLDRARPAFVDLTAAYEAARSLGDRPAGLLRLNMPRAVVSHIIEPILPGFCATYPEVEVEICGDDGFVDVAESGFDAGIRLGEYLQGDMVAVRLTPPFRFRAVGTAGFFATHGRPARPADLRRLPCIRIRQVRGSIANWLFMEGNRPVEVAVSGPVIVNEFSAALALARRGLALAHIAEPLVEDLIATGELETVLDEFAPTSPGVYLYYPGRTQVLPKLRAFIDYIRANQPMGAIRAA